MLNIKAIRRDLQGVVGGEDGLKASHLRELSDDQLVIEFIEVYGAEALEPYEVTESTS